MKVLFPKRRVKRGGGVKSVDVPSLHIGFNEEDSEMWGKLPFQDEDGELAYGGGAVVVIHEDAGNISILIIKSHTGSDSSQIGEVQVIDDTHTTEVIIDDPVTSHRP